MLQTVSHLSTLKGSGDGMTSQVGVFEQPSAEQSGAKGPAAHPHRSEMSAKREGAADLTSNMTPAHSMHAGIHILMCYSLIIAGAAMYSWYAEQGSVKTQDLPTAALSGFRALLVLAVFMFHAGLQPIPAVGDFILLSGATLSTSRLALPGTAKAPVASMAGYIKFIFARFMRILPMYWLYRASERTHYSSLSDGPCVPALFAWDLVLNLITLPYRQPSTFFLVDGFRLDHLWFIKTIVLLYLVYPFLERIVLGPRESASATRQRLLCLGALCCLVKLATVVWMLHLLNRGDFDHNNGQANAWYPFWQFSLYTCPVLRVPEFVLGMLLPHLCANKEQNIEKADTGPDPAADTTVSASGPAEIASPSYLTTCADIAAVLMAAWVFLAPQNASTILLTQMNAYCPIGAFIVWGLCFDANGPSRLGRLLRHRAAVWVGDVSYGVYLWHPLVLRNMSLQLGPEFLRSADAFRHFGTDATWRWAALPAAFMITLVISWATFRLVEEPVGAGARRFLRAIEGSSSQ
eukprot:gnl/TRDRNA2_/TRDRNA2_184123_c0_seq1.p1 gnl/TRDRNA2_/TRDRNA2_184123_c0~~gnl/TRDRNA2_/TRDRNA2_184123_c0_seq1.p1  ORF type:complete len:581 (+),score=40.05 gnl/TRDRNA2_/TRDRNA2_184123_c0_seq1:185-1744(+)